MEVVLQITAILVGLTILGIVSMYVNLVLKPKKLRWKLKQQGIIGPPPCSILQGNIPQIVKMKSEILIPPPDNKIHHDWHIIHFPHLQEWRYYYGNSTLTPFFLSLHVMYIQFFFI